jgi:hypothetical protein
MESTAITTRDFQTGPPRRCESESFRKVPSAGRPRIRAFAKLPPSQRPQFQPLTPRQATGLTPAHHPPSDGPRLTRSSEVSQRGPASRPASATLISFASAWHRDCEKSGTPCATPSTTRLKEISGAGWNHFAALSPIKRLESSPTDRFAFYPARCRPKAIRGRRSGWQCWAGKVR